MILIGESGATKASWALISSTEIIRFSTSGIRCGTTSDYTIRAILDELEKKNALSNKLRAIHFFCSGCFHHSRQNEMLNHFKQTFPSCPEIKIQSDMHAAGLSFLNDQDGFVIILGTGSVGFAWKNQDIQQVYGGKGFPGGDFLGGADLGQRLIQLFSNKKNHPLIVTFEQEYGSLNDLQLALTKEKLSPSEYGQFAPFVIAHKNDYIIAQLIQEAMNDFFTNMPQIDTFRRIGIIGSIGYYLQDEIHHFLGLSNLHELSVIRKPIDKLIELYVTNLKSS